MVLLSSCLKFSKLSVFLPCLSMPDSKCKSQNKQEREVIFSSSWCCWSLSGIIVVSAKTALLMGQAESPCQEVQLWLCVLICVPDFQNAP